MFKDLRKNKGITAVHVYTKLGIDKGTFNKFEDGKTELKVDWIPILSELYGISKEQIMSLYLKEKEGVKHDRS